MTGVLDSHEFRTGEYYALCCGRGISMRNRIEKSKVPHIISDNIGIMVVLLILCIIVSLATDKFLTSGNIISVLRQISINTYIALE